MEAMEVTLPRGEQRGEAQRVDLAGQKEDRYLVLPAGLGKRTAHRCLDGGPRPGVVPPDGGNEYHQTPPASRQSNLPVSGSPGTNALKASGSGLEDELLGNGLRIAKVEQKAPGIGQNSPGGMSLICCYWNL